jgi:hypothetical protein
MRERGVNYRVPFVDTNRALWQHDHSRMLGRELVQRHLRFNTDFDVDCLPSWLTPSALQVECVHSNQSLSVFRWPVAACVWGNGV